MARLQRIVLLSSLAFVAVTALAGGVALVLGSISPSLGTVLIPPGDYLSGSPFDSYALPGVALIALVAVPHGVAFFAVARHDGWAALLSAVAGFACLIWIFVQMIYIPFSPLQAIYFVLGLLEIGLTLLRLGVLSFEPHPRRSTAVPVGRNGSLPIDR
ncbi:MULTISPECIES: hypothetical protein [Microbacterium]|uniref:hypothetical protein n=1 Tax=Microbacterium TaxID=33882 RepID=UPI00166045FE|nr:MULTISPECIES: hypothetical protein [Microbacterium]